MALSKKEQELLEKLGIKVKSEDYIRPVEEEEHTKEMARWEAQSVLRSLKWPYPELVNRQCERPDCKKIFLTNYEANAYCSMECFKVELERRGLVWRPDRTFYEQWGNLEPPLMIPPEAIKAMRRLLSIVDRGNPVVSGNPEPGFVQEENFPETWTSSPALLVPYSDPDIQEEPLEEVEDSFLTLLSSLDE